MLLPIENLLTKDEAEEVLKELSSQQWLDGSSSAGFQAAKVKSNLQLDDSTEAAEFLQKFILKKISQNQTFTSAALPKQIYPPKFNCYQDGGHYGSHIDSAVMTLPNGQLLRTDISATLFLNDGKDYDGGELEIETKYGIQSIKLNAGDLLIYPATSLHQVKAVTKGARFAAFFWIESLVRDTQQREMLFDLDQSIQYFSTLKDAENDKVSQITSVYHNLIRQWAK
jgi:PKHD-type hydroxylase